MNIYGSIKMLHLVNIQQEQQRFTSFSLARGYIQYKPVAPSLNPEEQQDENPPPKDDYFLVFKSGHAKPIRLYRQHMLHLAQALPHAYNAVLEGDASYCKTIIITKTLRVTLEVNEHNDRYYLFLKKSFKPVDNDNDPEQDWIYTKSIIQLDPLEDDPYAMEKFVLSCSY